VNHTAVMSGAEVSLLDLIDGLGTTVEPIVAAPEGPLADAVRSRGVPFVRIPAVEGSLRLHPRFTPESTARMLLCAVAVGNIARSHRVDLIHANSIRAGLAVAVISRLVGVPAVVHVHDCLPPTPAARFAQGVLSHSASMALANSRYTADCFNGHDTGAPIEVVHNPVDLRRFDPTRVDRAKARELFGLPADVPALAVVAQITPWKGQETAVRTLHLLRERRGDIRLMLAGTLKFRRPATRYDNETYLWDLRDQITRLGLDGKVILLGEQESVPDLIRAVDVVLVPSWAEPFGRVVLEAMAMRTPVISTDIGGPPEIIVDGENGLLAPPYEPAPWADAVEAVLDDPELRERLVEHGWRTAQTFDRTTYVEHVLAVYRRATDSNANRRTATPAAA
jgi:glycosyltransferase involved in cell wall biosynthesis